MSNPECSRDDGLIVEAARLLRLCRLFGNYFPHGHYAHLHSSLGRGHLRRLFPDLSRVDDEFERVRILVLFHQLEVYKPFGIRYGGAVLEPVSGRFKQRGCEFILAVRGQAFHCLDQLSFRHAEVVDQEFCVVGTGEMFHALQVRLPIADVLIIKAVNDVFAQDKVWLIHIGLVVEQARGNQVCLMYRATLIAAARCGQDLLAQPYQIYFELCQHRGRGEILRERLVAMEQIPRILLNHDIDRIQQPLKVALLDERCAEIRHNEIADEQNALIRQVDEHRIVRFASLHRNELDAYSPDLQLGAAIDGDVRLEAPYVVEAETCAEELLVENGRRTDFAGDLFSVVAPGIETQAGI